MLDAPPSRGMNGGIHDAVNLTERLAAVWHGDRPDGELDRYDRQRRLITLEYVQKHTIQNKRNLEARDEADRDRFREEMRAIRSDRQKTHDYLERVSMIASLKRAAELGLLNHGLVIARESGQSSKHRSFNKTSAGVYWMPRFRGA